MLSEKECHLALKDMENGKSPGSDDLSSEFYRVFWDNINLDVVASINYSFEKRQMSICQKRGIISLVPKKDYPTNLLGNLRPISLLNTDHKIATEAIAKRLEAVLPNVINANQTGYIKGSFIGENAILISDNYYQLYHNKKFIRPRCFPRLWKSLWFSSEISFLRSLTYLTLELNGLFQNGRQLLTPKSMCKGKPADH